MKSRALTYVFSFIFMMMFSLSSLAQSEEITTEETVETTTTTTKEAPSAKPTIGERAHKVSKSVEGFVSAGGDLREDANYSVFLNWSPLDLLIPSKFGGALGSISSRSKTNELEFLTASFSAPAFIENIGGFSDTRITLLQRLYSSHNSLNFQYGLTYFSVDAHVGSRYLASATGAPANLNLIGSKTLGLMVGVGNRWTFPSGFTLGVDWVSWSQPLIVLDKKSDLVNYVQDEDDKRTLERAITLMSYIPRFQVLKVGIGWIF